MKADIEEILIILIDSCKYYSEIFNEATIFISKNKNNKNFYFKLVDPSIKLTLVYEIDPNRFHQLGLVTDVKTEIDLYPTIIRYFKYNDANNNINISETEDLDNILKEGIEIIYSINK